MEALEFLLQRYSDDGDSTLGLMLLLGGAKPVLQGYTLEDEERSVKVAGETRIPARRYELRLRRELTPKTIAYRKLYSWFEWHIEIVDVDGFVACYVHIGNKDKDTDGCVLLADMANNNVITDGLISGSAVCFERWYKKATAHMNAGGRVFLDVRDEQRLAA